MKMRKKMCVFGLVTLVLVLGSSLAQANTVTGSLWHVPEATASSAVVANVPGTTPDVKFDVNSPFNFNATNATVGAWLTSGGAFNVVPNNATILASSMDDFTTGTLVEFTGLVQVTNGQLVSVTHDDGLTLIIGGVNLGFTSGPTSPIAETRTYTGASGNQAFTLVYGEVQEGPAQLQVNLPLSNVPLPPSALLLGSGILGLVGLRFRRKA